MATPLDYLTENSVTPYPFRDGCSLIPIGSSVPLANNVFLDFQYTTTDVNVRRVALGNLRILVGPVEYDVTAVYFTFTIFSYNAVDDEWIVTTKKFSKLVSEIGAYTFFTHDFGDTKIKIVPGPGLPLLLANRSLNYSFAVGTTNNRPSENMAAEFSPSTIIPAQPQLTKITFKNVPSMDVVLTKTIAAGTTDITFQAGSNIQFNDNTENIGFVVERAAGTGLYGTCEEVTNDVIRSINGIEADTHGNIMLTTDECFKTIYRPLYQAGVVSPGLMFEHVCRPKCSADEVNAFAYYANRVQDGVNKLNGYIATIVQALQDQVTALEAKKTAVIVSPFIDAQDVTTIYNSRAYESIAIGLYDPNKQKMTCDLTAFVSSGIADETYFNGDPFWAGWVLSTDSSALQEENNDYKLPSFCPNTVDRISLFTSRGIDCRGSVLTNFVMHGPSTLQNQWVKLVMTAYENSVISSTAFKYHTLRPSAQPYFNVRSRRGIVVNAAAERISFFTVSIDLFNANPNSIGTTTFSTVVNSAHKITSASLRINNATKIDLTPSATLVSFSHSISYPQRAVLTFNLDNRDSKTDAAVDLAISLQVGSQTATLSSLTFQ